MRWTKVQYFEIGTQYYVTGRFSVFAWLVPVCGNLLHHAIEMYLKGHLRASMSEAELKRLGHSLTTIWERFKHYVNDASLAKFDDVVSELDRFESVRYPDEMIEKGAQFFIGRGNAGLDEIGSSSSPAPAYRLSLGLIDELVASLFRAASMNPDAFWVSVPDAKAYFHRDNAHFPQSHA